MARWLGIDHGSKRMGLAVGDAAGAIATPVAVIEAVPLSQAIGRILQVAKEYRVAGVVVGLPLNMDDSEGPQAQAARTMACQLAGLCRLDVRLWDERLSSFAADEALAGKLTRRQKKSRQDAVAAAVMLDDFLSRDGPAVAPRPSPAKPPRRP